MVKQRRMKAVLSCTLSLAVLVSLGTSELTSQSRVRADEAAHWSYEGADGPSHWAGACAGGKEQSPIDISGAAGADLPNVVFDYKPSTINVLNNGHTVQFNQDPGSSIQLDGVTYNLLQFHFHAPSEHTINGKQFPLELHLVHKDANGNLAVVGILYEDGTPGSSPRAEYLFSKSPVHSGDTLTSTHKFDASVLLPADRLSYRYAGSLTTPPCSEGVRWIVMKSPTKITPATLAALKHAMTPNNRPVQPLNTRTIQADISP